MLKLRMDPQQQHVQIKTNRRGGGDGWLGCVSATGRAVKSESAYRAMVPKYQRGDGHIINAASKTLKKQ